jgi:tetratricopeptide (TPR) repeat protein
MSDSTLPSCPYKGLQPYTEADRAWFFGRERDVQIVISNLYAAPLTILHGSSGVGKSSVLLAGAAPELRATPRTAVVVFRNWQDARFDLALKQAVLQEVARAVKKEVSIDPGLPLDEFLAQCTRGVRDQVFFIFDQFEEYFLYTPASADENGFDAQLARAVNRQEIRANFLLSMREDGLSKLDRFQGRISNLLGNLLRLEHLDRPSAADAIRKPLAVYNQELAAGQEPVTIEGGLVEVLLDQVKTGKVALDEHGQGQSAASLRVASAEWRVETPFLQLVLTRLWNEEMAAGSRRLQLSTLTRLGGAENIARTHLDKVMSRLNGEERDAAARLFRFLVTPSGSKIAQDPASLAAWTEMPETQVKAVLLRLCAEMRVLRQMSAAGQPDRYEIFHDLLAPAILDWRRRHSELKAQEQIRREEQARWAGEQEKVEQQRERERARWMRRLILALTALVVILTLGIIAVWQKHREATRLSEDLRIAHDQIRNDKALQEKSYQINDLIRDGQLAITGKKYDRAVEKLNQAIQMDAGNSRALMFKGYAQWLNGDAAAAAQSLEQSVKISPNYPFGHCYLALAYWDTGQPERALAAVKTTLELEKAQGGTRFRDLFKDNADFRRIRNSPEHGEAFLKLLE